MYDRYREEDLAHRVAEELEREEREAREKAGNELARLLFEKEDGFSGSTEVGTAETPAQAEAMPSVDAGARSKSMMLRRTPGQQMYLAIFGHDHDDVPPGIDNPPAA
jgi:hypothetical protein